MTERMSIGDFASVTQLSVKALRHYHELGLLQPAWTDPVTSYRYYTRDQARTAKTISLLRRLDMPLGEIRDLLTSAEADRTALLEAHRTRLTTALDLAQRRLESVHRLLQGVPLMNYDISLAERPTQRIASLPFRAENNSDDVWQQLTTSFQTLWQNIVDSGGTEDDITGVPIIIVHQVDQDVTEQEICLPVRASMPTGKAHVWDLPDATVVTARHVGPSEDLDPLEVMNWASAHGHDVGLPFRVVIQAYPPYFTGPGFEDSTQPVMDIEMPTGTASC